MDIRYKLLVGVDEVGRGPIAGPVAVGAFIFLTPEAHRMFRGVKESKQLTEVAREQWFSKILKIKEQGHINFCVTFAHENVIDTRGISYAIKKCLSKSLQRVSKNPNEVVVLLDGGLKAPVNFVHQKTIIKGDSKEKVIALASICAKVLRDRYMRRVASRYSAYGFDIHKGYGTRLHYEVIHRLGLTKIHRKSFCRRLLTS